MRILVFTEGTILDDRSRDGEWTLFGNAAGKLKSWEENGATIMYLSSKRKSETLDKVRETLRKAGVPKGELYSRIESEDYGQVAERVGADIIVEDDCVSIGGIEQTTYAKLKPELKLKTKSVIVPEFGGIDHLPDDPSELNC